MKFLAIILTGLCLVGCASNPWSRQWATQERIEQTLRKELPIGSSREAILKFFEKENIHVMELTPLANRPAHTLTVSFPLGSSRVPRRDLLVTFHLGSDGTAIKMTSVEGDAGFL